MNRKAVIILVIIVAVILLVLLIIYAVNLASGGGWGRNTATMNSGNLSAQAPTGRLASGGPSGSPRPPNLTTSPRSSRCTPASARPPPGPAAGTRRPATVAALARTRAALLAEHLQPWLPAYLDAVTDLETPGLTAWAQLTRHAISAESGSQPAPAQLPLALRKPPRRPARTAASVT